MTIGDQPAFPSEFTPGDKQWSSAGMTYRQWLVGQIAGGLSTGTLFRDIDDYALNVIRSADAIIAKMEGEGK